MQISENELRAILEEVEAELSPLLRSEREKLSKAVGDEVSSSASASPMGEEIKSAGRDMLPGERSPSLADEKSASAGAPPAEGSASAGSPEASAGSAGGDEGVKELAAQYAQLSPEELEMHLMALQAAMQQLMGGAEGSAGAAAPAGPAGAPPAGPEASASAGMPPMMGKAEKSASASASAEKSAHMKKEVSASASAEKSASYHKKEHSAEESSSKEESSSVSKSELEAVNAKLDVALKAVEFLTRPMRKAVTEFVSEEKPAANLTKNEVTAKLRAVCSTPSLSKSDRELVNGFYDGRVSLDRISHLLK
jgi:hypothetical protein